MTYDAEIPEVSFVRACIYLIFSTACVFIFKKNPFKEVARQDIFPLSIRSLSSTASLFIVIIAIKFVPLTIFNVVTNMTPFVSGVLAWIWLGDKLGVFQIVMMIFCFGGVVLVACSKNTDEDDVSKSSAYTIGIVLTGLLAVIFAVSAVSTRRLKTMHFSVL